MNKFELQLGCGCCIPALAKGFSDTESRNFGLRRKYFAKFLSGEIIANFAKNFVKFRLGPKERALTKKKKKKHDLRRRSSRWRRRGRLREEAVVVEAGDQVGEVGVGLEAGRLGQSAHELTKQLECFKK